MKVSWAKLNQIAKATNQQVIFRGLEISPTNRQVWILENNTNIWAYKPNQNK